MQELDSEVSFDYTDQESDSQVTHSDSEKPKTGKDELHEIGKRNLAIAKAVLQNKMREQEEKNEPKV